MIHPLIKDNVSIDKLKLIGLDFNHFDKRQLDLKVPNGLKFGNEILPCGFTNKGNVKDGLMIDIYHDDKLILEFNPNQVPIKKVDKILKNDWGINANVMDMQIKRIDLERTRLMDKTLIEYHNMIRYASSRIKPWPPLGTDTMNFGKTSSDKQFSFYTKVPKENNKIVRGEFRIFRDATNYDIHDLKYLHDIETLNSIYVKEFDYYMGRKLQKMLNSNNVISIMDDTDDLQRMINIWLYCKENYREKTPEFFKRVNFDMVPYELWMKFFSCGIIDKHERSRIKTMLEGLIEDSKNINGSFRLDMIQRDIRNLLKFRNVA
jgi:hypothetical protein